MTLINWEQPFYFALATGDTGGPYTGDPGTIPLPTYGNYGGADFSEGSFGGTPDTNTHGSPYLSFSALINDTDPSNNPLSPLDYAFYKHDVGTELASSPQETAAADLALIKDIQSLDRHGQLTDPEDSLYAGGTTLGMILDVELNGTPKQIQT